MASFDTVIKLLVDSRDAFREVDKLQKAILKASNAADQAKYKVIRDLVSEEAKSQEKAAVSAIKLNAAYQRRENLLRSIKRAGIDAQSATDKTLDKATQSGRGKRVDELVKAAQIGKNSLSVQLAANAALEKELQTQREINRTDAAQQQIAKKNRVGAEYDQRIARLKAVGTEEKALKKIEEERQKLSNLNATKSSDLARTQRAEVERLIEAQEKLNRLSLNSPGRQIASPLSSGPARTVLDTPQALRQKAKYYEQISRSIKPLSSPMRPQSVLGSDDAIRKKAKYYEQIAKSVKPLSSPLRPQSVLGSDESIRRKAEYYQKAAKSAEKAADEALRLSKAAGGPRSPIRGNKNTPGSPLYLEDQARKARKASVELERLNKAQLKNLGAGAVGAGFPLLFGGGPGAILGGLAGGALGGKEFGFEASIALSALGAQLDKVGGSARALAQNLNDPSALLEELSSQGFKVSKSLIANVEALEEQGRVADAATLAQRELVEKVGVQGVQAFERFNDAASNVQESAAKLALTIFTELEPAITGITKIIGDFLDQLTGPEIQRRFANLNPQEFQNITSQAADEITRRPDFGRDSTVDRLRYNQRINELIKERERVIKSIGKIEVDSSLQFIQNNNIAAEARERSKERAREELKFVREMYDLEVKRANLLANSLDNTVRFLERQRQQQLELARKADEGARARTSAQQEIANSSLRAFESGRTTTSIQDASDLDDVFKYKLKQDYDEIERRVEGLGDKLLLAGENTERVTRLTNTYREALRAAAEEANRLERANFETTEEVFLRRAAFLRDESKLLTETDEKIKRKIERTLVYARALDQVKKAGLDPLSGAGKSFIDATLENFDAANKQLTDFEKQLQSIATFASTQLNQALTDALVTTIDAAITGADNLAESLQAIASNLLKQIGAQLISAGIGGVGTVGSPGSGSGLLGQIFNRDTGGPVTASRPYIVGERGPELFIPRANGTVVNNADSRAALDRYSPNSSYNYSPQLSITTGPVMQMNNEDYIRREDFERGLRQASDDGAKRGEAMTLKRLKNSRSTRSTLGM